jgi:hypothetical protein
MSGATWDRIRGDANKKADLMLGDAARYGIEMLCDEIDRLNAELADLRKRVDQVVAP